MTDRREVTTSSSGPLPDGAEQVLEYALRYPDTFKMLAAEAAEELARRAEYLNGPDHLDQLRAKYADLVRPGEYEVGDLVRWKSGLRNRRRPGDLEAAIVIERLTPPVYDLSRETNSSYYREPLDVVLGMIGEEGAMVMFHFDGRRFEKVPERGGGSEARVSDARTETEGKDPRKGDS